MIVIDASVWISFLIQLDINPTVTQPWLSGVLGREIPIVAPILLLAEVGGAISRRLGHVETGEMAINQLLSIPTLHLIQMDHAQGIEASRIAAHYHLRGADAFYMAVAAYLKVPLLVGTTNILTAYPT